jgi:NAD(P)-dependent dehydrogenase (short-subunit alcohol dehydrogenase family)
VLERVGRIDVLVNNAGIGGLCVIEKTNDGEIRQVFETNVFGPLRLIRAVLPGMRERRGGAIVNVTSAAGLITGFGIGIYAASKHALEAAAETLALEVRSFGIRVANVEPGFFATPIIGKAVEGMAVVEASPYFEIEQGVHASYSRGMDIAGDPQVVAETIEHAIATDEPKLRYIVGVGVEALVTGRRSITDEQFLELATP